MDKLIINAAITGVIPSKSDNPSVPITPDEIAAEVLRCRDAGASIIHIHARDEYGKPSFKGEIYKDIITRMKLKCSDVLLSGSTSGRFFNELEKRAQVLDPGPGCTPDFGSLTIGSLNFPKHASVNEPDVIKSLALLMNEKGVVPELELFDLGMVDYAHYLIKKGIIKRPLYGNIILGSLGTLSATPHNLALMVNALPDGMIWSAGGIGRFQFPMNSLAVVMGGHVRVGLEDNLYYDADKCEPATNVGLIERIVKLAKAVGREIATPGEAREIIGLPVGSLEEVD